MSSTDDSVVTVKSHLNPAGTSRTYFKRIGYGATAKDRHNARFAFSKDPKPKAGNLFITKEATVETGAETGKDDSAWKFSPGTRICSSVGGACCCGLCRGGGQRRRKPARRGCVVFIVFLALLLDSLLLTCMAPIIPNYLRDFPTEDKNPNHNVTPSAITTTSSFSETTDQYFNDTSFTSATERTTIKESRLVLQHRKTSKSSANATYTKENTKISLLFASKTLVQVVANLIVGPLTERIGYTVPMFSGFVVLLLSTIAFAFGNTYELLFAARAFQGVGTALSTTSGMGLLATLYPDQTERAVAQTKAFSGLALGVLLGPPYGGVLYQFLGGKELPCLILAATALFEGVLQLCVMRPKFEREPVGGASLLRLLMDPYIMVTAAAITISNLTTAVLEPALPIWMFYTMDAETWLQGVAFVPSTLSYLAFLQLFGFLASKFKCFNVSHRWSCTMCGMVILAVSMCLVPYCSDFYILIGPMILMGFGLAQVCTCMLPHIGALVDHRHQPVYGSAYAITDNAFGLAFAVGPAISGPLIDTIGFAWTVRGVSLLILLFVPLVLTLRKPPGKNTHMDQGQETKLLVTS